MLVALTKCKLFAATASINRSILIDSCSSLSNDALNIIAYDTCSLNRWIVDANSKRLAVALFYSLCYSLSNVILTIIILIIYYYFYDYGKIALHIFFSLWLNVIFQSSRISPLLYTLYMHHFHFPLIFQVNIILKRNSNWLRSFATIDSHLNACVNHVLEIGNARSKPNKITSNFCRLCK